MSKENTTMPKNWSSIAREYWGDELNKILEVYTLDELWDELSESDRNRAIANYNDPYKDLW